MGNSLSKVVRLFHDRTNGGIVLDLDISDNTRTDYLLGPRQETKTNVKLVLTPEEVAERTQWETLRASLEKDLVAHGATVSTKQQLLQRRVAAPVLTPDPEAASPRSKLPVEEGCAGRIMYPHRVEVWKDFPPLVAATNPTGVIAASSQRHVPFILGLGDGDRKSDERSEELYWMTNALGPLRRIGGLLDKRTDGSPGCQGNPDFFLHHSTGQPTVLGESKATHNLPLPRKSAAIQAAYRAAQAAMSQPVPDSRPLVAWSYMGHPIAQLGSYMILNNCRFGISTSGTRS